MPPKEKFNRDTIMDAAFELVRIEGFKQLSARNIAKRLGCSTQPIYSSFKSIEELEEELRLRIKNFALSAILNHEDSESNFLSIGVGYFELSRNEPMLFGSLFIDGGLKWSFTGEDSFFKPLLEKMKKDNWLNKLSDEKLTVLFRDMFIYTHGLATQTQLSNEPISGQAARELLRRMGGVLIAISTISGNFDVEKMMEGFHECRD